MFVFPGLKRVGGASAEEEEEDTDTNMTTTNKEEESPTKVSEGGVELNLRGIPARKRKKNSLIYGADDLVSIPIKSPKKRGPKTPAAAGPPSSTATAKDKRMSSLAGERTSKSAPPTV